MTFSGFEDWWVPYTLGVGPAGAHVGRLHHADRERLLDHCADLLPSGSFEVPAVAWCVEARVPARRD